MAVPTIDNVTTATGSAGGSVTGSLPSGSGDFLVAFVGVDNDNAVTATGWTQVRTQGCGGGSVDTTVTMLTAPSNVSSFVFSWSTDNTRIGHVTIFRVSGASGTVNAHNSTGPATGNTTATTRAIPSLTTTVADCLLLSGMSSDAAAGTTNTWPNGWTEQSDLNTAGGETLTTGSSSQASAGAITGGNVTSTASDHHAIIVAAFEPAAGGQNHSQSPTDQAGLSDSAAVGLVLTSTQADDTDLTDAGVTRAHSLTVAENVAPNLSDSFSVVAGKLVTRTDAMGLSDAGISIGYSPTGYDTLALSDSATVDLQGGGGFTQTPTDQARPTDTRTFHRGLVRADATGPADAVGLAHGRIRADALALTDSVTVQLAKTVTRADQANPTDAVTRKLTKGIVDSVGLADVGTSTNRAVTGADTAGLGDSVQTSLSGQGAVNRTDQTNPTDTVTRAAAYVRAVTDQARPTDAVTRSLGKAATDQARPTDAASTTGSFVRTFADTVGLDDQANVQKSGSGTLDRTDQAGLTDTVARQASLVRAQADDVGLEDAATPSVGRTRSVTDQARPTDASSRSQGKGRADQLGLADTIVLQVVKGIVDSAGLDDEFARVSDTRRSAADAAGLRDTPIVDLQLAFEPVNDPRVTRATNETSTGLAENRARATLATNSMGADT